MKDCKKCGMPKWLCVCGVLRIVMVMAMVLSVVSFGFTEEVPYDIPEGHKELAAMDFLVEGGTRTLAIIDINGDQLCDYGLHVHHLDDGTIEEYQVVTCPVIRATMLEWMDQYDKQMKKEGNNG